MLCNKNANAKLSLKYTWIYIDITRKRSRKSCYFAQVKSTGKEKVEIALKNK